MPLEESDLTGGLDLSEDRLEAEQVCHTPGGEIVSGAEKSITSAIYERIRSILFIQTTQTVHASTDLCESWEKQETAGEGEV